MPKRKTKFDQAEQSERFRQAAQGMIDAGELSPIEGKKALDSLVRNMKRAGTPGDGDPRQDD